MSKDKLQPTVLRRAVDAVEDDRKSYRLTDISSSDFAAHALQVESLQENYGITQQAAVSLVLEGYRTIYDMDNRLRHLLVLSKQGCKNISNGIVATLEQRKKEKKDAETKRLTRLSKASVK